MPEFSPAGYLLLGLTAIVGFLAGVLGFALLRIMGAARDSGRHLRESNVETALLSAALQEAVTKLKAQERTSLARAEASERLNAQIVEGLTSGLLVAGGDGRIRMLNPAGHRILGIAPRPMPADIAELLQDVPALAALVRDAVNDGRHRGVAPPRRDRTRRWPVAPGRDAVAVGRRRGRGNRRHLPVHGSLARRHARRAAALEGRVGPPRRTHRRAGPRVPQRPGDHPRLCPPARSRRAAGTAVDLCHRPASRDRCPRRTGDELPELRAARAGLAPGARSRAGRAAGGGRRRSRRSGRPGLGAVRRGRRRRRAAAPGVLEPGAQRPRGVPWCRHRAARRRARRGDRRATRR